MKTPHRALVLHDLKTSYTLIQLLWLYMRKHLISQYSPAKCLWWPATKVIFGR